MHFEHTRILTIDSLESVKYEGNAARKELKQLPFRGT